MAHKYIETKMDSEEGVTYSPSEIGEDWIFTGDADNTTAYLLKLNRKKGKKDFKILLGVTDYFSMWVGVTFKELMKIINPLRDERTRNFSNCEVTMTYHVETTSAYGLRLSETKTRPKRTIGVKKSESIEGNILWRTKCQWEEDCLGH